MILWKSHGLIFEVLDVMDPSDARIKLARDDQPKQPFIVMRIAVPVAAVVQGEVTADDFFALVNPAHTDAIDQMMKGRQVTQ